MKGKLLTQRRNSSLNLIPTLTPKGCFHQNHKLLDDHHHLQPPDDHHQEPPDHHHQEPLDHHHQGPPDQLVLQPLDDHHHHHEPPDHHHQGPPDHHHHLHPVCMGPLLCLLELEITLNSVTASKSRAGWCNVVGSTLGKQCTQTNMHAEHATNNELYWRLNNFYRFVLTSFLLWRTLFITGKMDHH